VTPIFYKLRQNTALSRQRSRVRAPSSPPYIPNDLSGIGGNQLGCKRATESFGPLQETSVLIRAFWSSEPLRSFNERIIAP
jgi:hypothetical protein